MMGVVSMNEIQKYRAVVLIDLAILLKNEWGL